MRFETLDGSGPARVKLEQVTDTHFRLLEGFRYVDARGGIHEVEPQHLRCTDLASVPRPFHWYVGSHGRHTLAALLHDHQVTRLPGESLADHARRRTEADDRFLEMLNALGVPWIRRLLMWGAVHAATRSLRHVPLARVAVLIWLVAAAGGTWTLVGGALTGDWVRVAAAVAAPLAGAVLWTVPSRHPLRRWWCGLVVSYGVLFFLPAWIFNGIALAVNACVDRLTGGSGPPPWANPDGCPE